VLSWHVLRYAVQAVCCTHVLWPELTRYAVLWCASQGKLLVCVNNKVMLYKMSTTADGRQELVSDCSPVGVQVLCLHLAVRCVLGVELYFCWQRLRC
jgi:hypothetical protein